MADIAGSVFGPRRVTPIPSIAEQQRTRALTQQAQAEAEQQRLANLQAQRETEDERRAQQAIIDADGDLAKVGELMRGGKGRPGVSGKRYMAWQEFVREDRQAKFAADKAQNDLGRARADELVGLIDAVEGAEDRATAEAAFRSKLTPEEQEQFGDLSNLKLQRALLRLGSQNIAEAQKAQEQATARRRVEIDAQQALTAQARLEQEAAQAAAPARPTGEYAEFKGSFYPGWLAQKGLPASAANEAEALTAFKRLGRERPTQLLTPEEEAQQLRLRRQGRSSTEAEILRGESVDPYVESLRLGQTTITNVPQAIRGKVLDAAHKKGIAIVSDAERDKMAQLGRTKPILASINELSERINTQQGVIAKLSGGVERVKAQANLNDDVAEYQSLILGFTPLVARAVGHVGVLTEQDVISVRALFPTPGDSKSLRDRKIQRLEGIMGGVQEQTEKAILGPAGSQQPAIVQRSPSTGQYRHSTDGGKTWQPGQPPAR